MDSGLYVFICSISFVLVVLFKQNVLIFVQSNLGNHTHSWLEERLFHAYDLDWNGVIDIEEFQIIAKQISPETFAKTGELAQHTEPEIGVPYLNLGVEFSGVEMEGVVCRHPGVRDCLSPGSRVPLVNNTITIPTHALDIFVPKRRDLGYSWYLYKGRLNDYSNYFSYMIKPYQKHYILSHLLSQFHWNVLFDMRHGNPYSVAMVTGISDTHVRINFILTAEYQINRPPESSVWLKPGYFRGEIVYSQDFSSVSYFKIELPEHLSELPELELQAHLEVEWGEEQENLPVSVMRIRNAGASYSYKIRDNRLVAVVSEQTVGYSDTWYKEVSDWESKLSDKYLK